MGVFDNIVELKERGLHYSKMWNIVESDEWANLQYEEGNGGFGENHPMKLPENKEKLRQRMTGENNPMKRLEVRVKNSVFQNRPEVKEKFKQEHLGKNHPMNNLEARAKMANTKGKDYSFIGPQNKTIQVHNLRKFCRENNLNSSHMVQVAKGKEQQHKGWKVEYEKEGTV